MVTVVARFCSELRRSSDLTQKGAAYIIVKKKKKKKKINKLLPVITTFSPGRITLSPSWYQIHNLQTSLRKNVPFLKSLLLSTHIQDKLGGGSMAETTLGMKVCTYTRIFAQRVRNRELSSDMPHHCKIHFF